MAEQDPVPRLVNTLLMTPYHDLTELYSIHEQLFYEDSASYTEMAAWYAENGQERDHKEMFVIILSLYNNPIAMSAFSRFSS